MKTFEPFENQACRSNVQFHGNLPSHLSKPTFRNAKSQTHADAIVEKNNISEPRPNIPTYINRVEFRA